MENLEKISVIVPIYNIEQYLKNCVDSIINQSYKNLEIILVDDGSTDNSGKMCDEYKNSDARVKVIHKENGGLASARNIGLDNATGNYIGFIDGDDIIHPDFYSTLYNLLLKENVDIAECNFLRIPMENSLEVEKILSEENKKQDIENIKYDNKHALNLLFGSYLTPYIKKVVVWNKLYKKELWQNIRFPLGRLHEDEFTTFRILYEAKTFAETNSYLHGYMQTKNSIMRQTIKAKRVQDNLEAYVEACKFFKEKNELEIEVKTRRKLLEYYIELSGKVLISDNEESEKKDLLKNMENDYKISYEKYMDFIKKNTDDEYENKVDSLLDRAYMSLKNNVCVGNYWDELQKLIKKEI